MLQKALTNIITRHWEQNKKSVENNPFKTMLSDSALEE